MKWKRFFIDDIMNDNATPSDARHESNNATVFPPSSATAQQEPVNIRQASPLLPVSVSEERIPNASGCVKEMPKHVKCDPLQSTWCAAVLASGQSTSPPQGSHVHHERERNVTNTEESLKETRKYVDRKPYECETCQKSFDFKYQLKRHLFVHSNERPHRCEICDGRFKSSRYLIDHRRYVHQLKNEHGETNDKHRFKCGTCQKMLSQRYLKLHVLVHTKVRQHQCEICGKTFKWKTNFTAHKRRKHSEKKYGW